MKIELIFLMSVPCRIPKSINLSFLISMRSLREKMIILSFWIWNHGKSLMVLSSIGKSYFGACQITLNHNPHQHQ